MVVFTITTSVASHALGSNWKDGRIPAEASPAAASNSTTEIQLCHPRKYRGLIKSWPPAELIIGKERATLVKVASKSTPFTQIAHIGVTDCLQTRAVLPIGAFERVVGKSEVNTHAGEKSPLHSQLPPYAHSAPVHLGRTAMDCWANQLETPLMVYDGRNVQCLCAAVYRSSPEGKHRLLPCVSRELLP